LSSSRKSSPRENRQAGFGPHVDVEAEPLDVEVKRCVDVFGDVADADRGHFRSLPSDEPLQELFIPRTVLGVRYHRRTLPRDRTSAQAAPARALSRRAGFLLVQLGTHAHRRFADRLARLDLHPRHFGMLSHLGASEGQSQQALSIALGIHRSAVVALVDDLEHRGLAERRRDPSDRRAYTLYLTPPGRAVLADLARIAEDHEAELLTALNASERSQLISLLQRVAKSQGLAAGVHPNLTPREGDDHTAEKDGETLHERTRRRSR
jgi:DNA-binding MarR family transcriptional regulator